MKKISFAIATLLFASVAAHAADKPIQPPVTPPKKDSTMQLNPHICPAPYEKFEVPISDGIAKGEFFCKKKPAPCPSGFYGSVDLTNGDLTCHPEVSPKPPLSWSNGKLTGIVIFTSTPQPMISCPTSPEWQWGTAYYTQSWNIMGCKPRSKPAS